MDHPILGRVYAWFAALSITSISALYLRLYFLPSSQSVPPSTPPPAISDGRLIYECPARQGGPSPLEPESGTKLVLQKCDRPSCAGRWKPARARHCSDCGTCRMGFDHHCTFVRPPHPVCTDSRLVCKLPDGAIHPNIPPDATLHRPDGSLAFCSSPQTPGCASEQRLSAVMEGVPDTRRVVCLDMVLVHRWWARRTICWGDRPRLERARQVGRRSNHEARNWGSSRRRLGASSHDFG